MKKASLRFLVTGGAGCLGSNLVEHLLPKGHRITVIDNYATGRRESLPHGHPGLETINGSITDGDLVTDVFETFRPTHVLHCAAAYKDPDDWGEDASTNVLGSVNVARAALQVGVTGFVNFQTALCYGTPREVPIPVDHPTAPRTSYGISKTAGEAYLLNSGLPVVSLRLANVCAPRLSIGPLPTFYQRLKDGKSCFCSDTVRDFLDFSDLSDLIDHLLETPGVAGTYNVSTGEGHTIKEVFDLVVEHLGITLKESVPIVPAGADDVPQVVLDPSHTLAELGWQAKVSFTETLHRMLAWYDRYGVGHVHSHLRPPREHHDC